MRGFLDTAREQGTLNDILQEAGYRFENDRWNEPELVGVEHMSVGLREVPAVQPVTLARIEKAKGPHAA